MEPLTADQPPKSPPLTWDVFVSNVPCCACGLPFRDEKPWSNAGKGSLYYDADAKAAAAQEQWVAECAASSAGCLLLGVSNVSQGAPARSCGLRCCMTQRVTRRPVTCRCKG